MRKTYLFIFSVVLNGEFAGAKFRQRKHLFFLPICGIMGMGDENGRTEKSQDHSVKRCGL